MADAVRVEGLADLRRDLRQIEPDARREVTKGLKEAAAVVAVRGRAYAPRGTRPIPETRKPRKRLADTIAPGASGNSAYVRSRAVYGPKIERQTAFLTRALDDTAEQVVEKVGDALDGVFTRHGFR